MAEQLLCKHQVGGSNPLLGSRIAQRAKALFYKTFTLNNFFCKVLCSKNLVLFYRALLRFNFVELYP